MRWAHESHGVGFHMDTARIRRTLPAIRKRDSDLEAQDLYSKFYRYKLEMFNFPIHVGKSRIHQMQSYSRQSQITLD